MRWKALFLDTFASRGFSVAAPAVWNALPSGVRHSSIHTFCHLLKTHCFQQALPAAPQPPLAARPSASDSATD